MEPVGRRAAQIHAAGVCPLFRQAFSSLTGVTGRQFRRSENTDFKVTMVPWPWFRFFARARRKISKK